MMKTKKAARRPVAVGWDKIHKEYVATLWKNDDKDYGWIKERDLLRMLSKQHGVPFAALDRRAGGEGWEQERKAADAWAWHKDHGYGARTEDEFCRAFSEDMYPHVTVKGLEGVALGYAFGRDAWRRMMGPAFQWKAHLELKEAKRVFDAIEAARNAIRLGIRIPGVTT